LVFYSNTGRISIIHPIIFKYLVPVNYTTGTPGDFVASGSSLVLPRAAADMRGQHSTLQVHYTGASIVRYAMQGQQRGAQERRREGGTRERGKGRRKSLGLLVVRLYSSPIAFNWYYLSFFLRRHCARVGNKGVDLGPGPVISYLLPL
jgi:hypothetical protein